MCFGLDLGFRVSKMFGGNSKYQMTIKNERNNKNQEKSKPTKKLSLKLSSVLHDAIDIPWSSTHAANNKNKCIFRLQGTQIKGSFNWQPLNEHTLILRKSTLLQGGLMEKQCCLVPQLNPWATPMLFLGGGLAGFLNDKRKINGSMLFICSPT